MHKNNCQLVKLLVSLNAQLEHADSLGETALFTAIARGKLPVIHELLRQGCRINHCNTSGETVLFLAIRMGRKDLVELLLANGANVDIVNKHGSTPLLLALELFENAYSSVHATRKKAPSNMCEISRILIPLCRNLNHQHPNKGSALRITLNIEATHSPQDLHLSKFLLHHGAKPDSLFFLRYGGLVASNTGPEAEFFTEKFFNMAIMAGANLHREKTWLITVFMEMPEELEPYQPLFSALLEKASNPLTLLELSCMRIRGVLHGRLWKRIDRLPLPTTLKDMLKLKL